METGLQRKQKHIYVESIPVKKILVTKTHKIHNDKNSFKESVCVFAISVGQKANEGENLAATIDFINSNFKSCIIALGDTLQRFNLTFLHDLDARNSYKKSLEDGSSWLIRNKPIYSELKIPFQVTRWDEWLNHEDYKSLEIKLKKIYKKDQSIRDSFNKTAEDFKERFRKILIEKNIEITDELLEKVKTKSVEYLKEESIIMTSIWATEGFNYILYPSPILEAVEKTREKLLDKGQENYSKWLEFGFDRVNMEPERYEGLLAEKYHNIESIKDENTLILKKAKSQFSTSSQILFKNQIDIVKKNKISLNELPFKTVAVVGAINNTLMELNQAICLKNEKPHIDIYFFFILAILEKFKSELKDVNDRKETSKKEESQETDFSIKKQ